MSRLTRRLFGKEALSTVFAEHSSTLMQSSKTLKQQPRWRGFNLTQKLSKSVAKPYSEKEFDLIAGWNFNYVRLPLDFSCWTDSAGNYDEIALKEIDMSVEFGIARGIHVTLALHRVPGYEVSSLNPWPNLWSDGTEGDRLRREFVLQWQMLSERYQHISGDSLSFGLVNEPGDILPSLYYRVCDMALEVIRRYRPDRLVIADGLKWGGKPVLELLPLQILQSTRGYFPFQLSHFNAGWIGGSKSWPTPRWPLPVKGESEMPGWPLPVQGEIDKKILYDVEIAPWLALTSRGVSVNVGEWGAHREVPHNVALAWMEDQLSLWQEQNWGWSLWNLCGSFGVLDSGRKDVEYELYQGHKLDRMMLELILRY